MNLQVIHESIVDGPGALSKTKQKIKKIYPKKISCVFKKIFPKKFLYFQDEC